MERKSDMKRSCIAGSLGRSILPLFNLGLVILSACTLTAIPVAAKFSTPAAEKAPAPCRPAHQVAFLTTFHSELVDASSGCQVSLTGVNWFGFETSTFAPHGLWARNWQDMLKQIAQAGFNTIRLPFTNQLFDPGNQPNSINYQLNPDLKGLQGLALMDRIIQGAHNVGLKIILDRHDPTADHRPPLWYTDHISQAPSIQDWRTLTKHYRGHNTIICAHLANEPHSTATWCDGNPSTDCLLPTHLQAN